MKESQRKNQASSSEKKNFAPPILMFSNSAEGKRIRQSLRGAASAVSEIQSSEYPEHTPTQTQQVKKDWFKFQEERGLTKKRKNTEITSENLLYDVSLSCSITNQKR